MIKHGDVMIKCGQRQGKHPAQQEKAGMNFYKGRRFEKSYSHRSLPKGTMPLRDNKESEVSVSGACAVGVELKVFKDFDQRIQERKIFLRHRVDAENGKDLKFRAAGQC
jgi:hypothetical protein